MGTLLIIVGVIVTAGGIYLTTRTDAEPIKNSPAASDTRQSTAHPKIEPSKPSVPDIKSEPKEASSEAKPQKPEQSSKEKGNDFEAYLADIFKANNLAIKEWNQGTVTDNGAMGENALRPDFHIEQPGKRSNIDYWIEAKWRKRIGDDNFTLRPDQLERYKSFQRSQRRKVIICLGVGGTPKEPTALFVIPVDSMTNEGLSFDDLTFFRVQNPKTNLPSHISDWFFNKVFKK